MKHHMIRNELHPGITMHKIPVQASVEGAMFVLGITVLFLVGLPGAVYFLVLAVLCGIGIAGLLQWMHR